MTEYIKIYIILERVDIIADTLKKHQYNIENVRKIVLNNGIRHTHLDGLLDYLEVYRSEQTSEIIESLYSILLSSIFNMDLQEVTLF